MTTDRIIPGAEFFIHPGMIRCNFVFVGNQISCYKKALIYHSLGIYVDSITIDHIIQISSCKLSAIGPCHNTLTITQIILELTFIFS